MGGLPVFPYQPADFYKGKNNGWPWNVSGGEDLYRRGLYTFWRRTTPYPSFVIFDAPDRAECTADRPRTNTPLQALVTLNDPQFVEAGRRLAETAMKENPDQSAAIAKIAERVLLRPLKPAENAVLNKTMSELEAGFTANQDAAKAYIAIGDTKPDPALPAPRLAALAMVATQLLNLDETLNK